MELLLSVILSFIPALCYAWVIYWLDRYEKEPLRLLGGVFLWGAVVAVIGAVIWSSLFQFGVALFTGDALADVIGTTVIAPVVEESLKGMAVLLVFLIARYEFDSLLDGIVYAGIAALGFAATENVLYLYSTSAEEGVGGLLVLFVLRVILGGWNHAVYTSFTGMGLAIARLSRVPFVKVTAPTVGLLVAMFAHGLHNSMVVLLSDSLGGFAATVLVDWVGWVLVFGVVLWAINRERRWISAQLLDEVDRGTISAQQYQTACSTWGQSAARLRALTSGRYRKTWRFYQLCGELAQKKHQQFTLGEIGANSTIQSLRAELAQLAPQVS